jgi:uncharacterized membrane protein (UPF0127 family)
MFLVVIIVIAGIILVSVPWSSKKPSRPGDRKVNTSTEIPFRHDADCHIYRMPDSLLIASFKVEVADAEEERMRGLMYRGKMERDQGMYFIFEREEQRSFWMKNTYISLDIIYIDKENRIVSIQKYTQPLSPASLPSTGPAKYVLEINAGLSDRLGIEPGDLVLAKAGTLPARGQNGR